MLDIFKKLGNRKGGKEPRKHVCRGASRGLEVPVRTKDGAALGAKRGSFPRCPLLRRPGHKETARVPA